MGGCRRTEFLLDDLEDLLLVELLWKTLDRSQGLAAIALCDHVSTCSVWGYARPRRSSAAPREAALGRLGRGRTLNPNMDIVLSLFDVASGVVFVGFGEGVYSRRVIG